MTAPIVVAPVPNLPVAPTTYGTRYHDQLNMVLRLFFNQLRNNLISLFGIQGGRFLNTPYGQFSSTVDQTAAATTAAYAFEYDTSDQTNGVTLASASEIAVDYEGIYNVQFSAQFVNTDSAEQDADVWFRTDGADVANSNSRISIVKSHGSGDGHAIMALNYLVHLKPDEPLKIMWCVTNTSVSLQAFPAGTTPTRPAIPSVIVTVTYVSAAP